MNSSGGYAAALALEQQTYANCLEVHDLPAAFHYWSNRYLLPKMLPYGFSSPDGMFLKVLREQCERTRFPRFCSLGAGNGDLELKLAGELTALGHRDFLIECLDLNVDMLARGRAAAESANLGSNLAFCQGDFNEWVATGEYDAVIANQSLHHVVNLEGLFAQIQSSLAPTGSFAISDMIGRNGHRRWPESLRIVREFWRQLPPSYRLNLKLGGYEEIFADWDCSGVGFEGIRSQDVLPLLLEHFHFEIFIPFGNLIDPFVDRAFGGHFDVSDEWDRKFLDRVHERDERELAAGHLTPTHMLAVVTKVAGPATLPPAAIRRSVRPPDLGDDHASVEPTGNSYEWTAWPHSVQRELEIACARLAESECGSQLRERTAWALTLREELEQRTRQALGWRADLEQRTVWARSLERDVEERTLWANDLEQQLGERTAWANSLVEEVRQHADVTLNLQTQLEERTAWAEQLDRELSSRTAWAQRLEEELQQQQGVVRELECRLQHPLLHTARAVSRAWGRWWSRLANTSVPRSENSR